MPEMIPFGKYKGQPIEVLESDPQYADWIAQQQWAKERYPQIVNIIINKFGESEETPDHNAMQAKFMDRRYCAMLVELLGGFIAARPQVDSIVADLYSKHGNELSVRMAPERIGSLADLIHRQQFEVAAVDVSFGVQWTGFLLEYGTRYYRQSSCITVTDSETISAELKPVIGDDYPAVLRQMRNNCSSVLVYGSYNGTGVDEKTFRLFFEMQKIRVAKESEIMSDCDAREKNAIEKIKSELSFCEKIICSRVTVGGTAKP